MTLPASRAPPCPSLLCVSALDHSSLCLRVHVRDHESARVRDHESGRVRDHESGHLGGAPLCLGRRWPLHSTCLPHGTSSPQGRESDGVLHGNGRVHGRHENGYENWLEEVLQM